ncbi:MAG TPA: caspase family protein [Pyrinomonadaceae bacterium]|nr:caspase family protein [Pyrinomonadaceae bacterium]
MKIGITVNVGLNSVTSTVYSANPLKGCEKDARAMFEIAKARGFDMNLSKPPLLGAEATHENVTKRVTEAAAVLKPGDLFFFSFAGHGTFKFLNSAEEEPDKRDESIVLTDHFMTDNYWRKELWPKFKPGVRAIAIADCCHAETILFAQQIERATRPDVASVGIPGNLVAGATWPFRAAGNPSVQSITPGLQPPAFRMITEAQGRKELEIFKAFYDKQDAAPAGEIGVSRLFLSACKDGQTAADGEDNGVFTAALLKVWDNGNFEGNYKDLMAKVGAQFAGTNQTPMFKQIGEPDVSSEKPFTI